MSIVLTKIFNTLRNNNLFRDSLWALIGGTLGKGLSFLSGIFVAKFLGSTIFGEYGTIRATLTYVAIVSTFGFGYTATKFIAEYLVKHPNKTRHLIDSITYLTIIIGSLFALLQMIFAEQIATFIEAPHLEKTIRIFSILTLINAITTTQIAILAGLKKFKDIATINTVVGVITFVASLGMTYYFGLNGALTALLLSFTTQLAISQIAIAKSKWNMTRTEKISIVELCSILSYSFPVALQDSLYTITYWLSMLLIIRFANYSEVGIINAANIWQSIVISIPAMLKNVMFSHLSSASDHKNLVKNLLSISLWSSLIPTLFVTLFSGYIENLYGESFAMIRYTIIVVCCSAVLICLGEVFVYELLSRGKSWFVFSSRLVRDMITLSVASLLLANINSGHALVYTSVALAGHFIYLILMSIFYKKTI